MKLTIGIPVYNGEEFIEQTLQSIINANFDFSEVEVIVSDNNSSDKTCEIVDKYSSVKLFKHSQNLGYDKNVDRLFEYASGDYVWTIGADDIIILNDMREISELVSHVIKYSVIFIGEGETEYAGVNLDPETFLYKTNFRSGFLSNNIINRKMWLDIDRNLLIGSAWIHYAMVLKLLPKAPSRLTNLQYVKEIEASKDEKSWGKNGNMIFTGLKLVEIFSNMSDWGYSKKMLRRSKMVIKGAYPRLIILSKIDGFRANYSVICTFISYYKEFPSFWLLDIWVLLTPAPIFKISHHLFKFFKSR